MPWTVKRPPTVARNWGAEEKRRCVAAANAALQRHPDDEQGAIFACIAAAGRSKKGNQMGEVVAEAKKKTEDGVEFPAAAYVYVPDPDKPSTWKLRIWDDLQQKVTARQVGRAIAALSPGGFRGQRVQIPAADLPGVKRELRRLWRRFHPDEEEPPAHIRESIGIAEAGFLTGLGEATDKEPEGRVWEVVLIAAGPSANGRDYPEAMLRKAAPLFEGVKAYADHPMRSEKYERGGVRSVRDVVGWFEDVQYRDRALRATFHLLESADDLRRALVDAWRRGKKDLMGLSINAEAMVAAATDGRPVVEALTKVHSVDLVTQPAAGGRLERLVASVRQDGRNGEEIVMDEDAIQEMIDRAVQSALDGTTSRLTETLTGTVAERVQEAVAAALAARDGAEKPAEGADDGEADGREPDIPEPVREALAQVEEAKEALQKQTCAIRLEAVLTASELPDVARKRLRERFGDRVFEQDELDAAVKAERDYLAALVGTRMQQFGRGPAIETGDAAQDKWFKRMMGLYENKDVDGMPAFRGLREAYYHWRLLRGDRIHYTDIAPQAIFESMKPGQGHNLSRNQNSYEKHLHEAVPLLEAVDQHVLESMTTSSWGQVFADVQYRMLIKAYQTDALYNEWRLVVSDIENVPDFQTRHWIRVGGFANLSSVAEQGTYPNLTSPTDEEVTYSLTKFGGLHDITMETIVNDQVGALRRIPLAMARAAKRTLYEDIFDLITTDNPTMDYDSVALYNASSHGNTPSTSVALTLGALSSVRQAMRAQTAYNESSLILGELNLPKYLIVPNELEMVARRIVNPSDAFTLASTADTETADDPHAYKNAGIEVIVYDKLTDSTAWYVVADPNKVPTVVVGFLAGQDQPELIVQDNPATDSTFTADKITTKVRIIYGFDVLDHRSFYYQNP